MDMVQSRAAETAVSPVAIDVGAPADAAVRSASLSWRVVVATAICTETCDRLDEFKRCGVDAVFPDGYRARRARSDAHSETGRGRPSDCLVGGGGVIGVPGVFSSDAGHARRRGRARRNSRRMVYG